jgi:hypothetical protein
VKNAQMAKERKNGKIWGEKFPPILKAGGTRFSKKTKHFIIKAVCVKIKAGRIFPPKRPPNPTTNARHLLQKTYVDFPQFRGKIWTSRAARR